MPRSDDLQELWKQFRTDVFGKRASVQPVVGWLLTALLALVLYLTIVFAPDAFRRSQGPHGADPSGVISVATGYLTIIAITMLALAVGCEPIVRRRWDDYRFAQQSGATSIRRRASHWLLWPLLALWRTPSTVLSIIDYVLVRPVAFLVGVTQTNWRRRYLWGATVLIGAATLALFAPPALGLTAAGAGLVAILAIIRRWTWVEADREVFLVQRSGKHNQRIGFSQDLRDEAMCALTFLFILVPLGLRQVQIATCAASACAFAIDDGSGLSVGTFGQALDWIGYFGAELAKSVPFVDWSEVFHVANGSPIKPVTEIGAQLVFAVRAGLDLLLLAAVLQAVQIASRLSDQEQAFQAGRLPILDPFSEQRKLRWVAVGIDDALDLRPADQPAIANFPEYDEERLRELVSGATEVDDPLARLAAVALLARQHASGSTDEFLGQRAKLETDPELRAWVLTVVSGQVPDTDPNEAVRARLKALVTDVKGDPEARPAAVRRLGRMPMDWATSSLLLERLADRREQVAVRADAAVALTKLGSSESATSVEALANEFKGPLAGEFLLPAMATAYAIARLSQGASAAEIAELFDTDLRRHARRAALICAEPMKVADASEKVPGHANDQLVRIAPGEAGFPASFTMGNANILDATPATRMTMTRAFALGRYAVTLEEYRGFAKSTGTPHRWTDKTARSPAVHVSRRNASGYCSWLERITGERFRLPSEAEWEYVCRAGTDTVYSWGDEWDSTKASSAETRTGKGVTDVGSYLPNPWGLWDMHGNVLEWCADPAHLNYTDRPTDDRLWSVDGDYSQYILRGGSWFDDPSDLRSAYRFRFQTVYRTNTVGFRIARTL